jgi:ribosomal protein S19
MHDKPEAVKTHLRNMVILPEMIGSVVGVYNGKTYVGVEIKVPLPPTDCPLPPLPQPCD